MDLPSHTAWAEASKKARISGERPTRRRFTAGYKLKILREADRCTRPGELGALLGREGLYWSHLSAWRRLREVGVLAALAPKKRGRKTNNRHHLLDENQRLRREIEHLQTRLRQVETIIEMQTAETITEVQAGLSDMRESS